MPTGYTDFYRGLFITIEALLTSTPVDGQVDKAPTSDWAFDHKADANAHHIPAGGALSGTFPADSYCAIEQGTWQYGVVASGLYYKALRSMTPAVGDGLMWHTYVDLGSYEMVIALSHWNDCGIVQFKIGPELIYTIDAYNAANVVTTTNFWFDITENPGPKSFYFRISGKNAASSNYRMNFLYWSIRKVL